MLIYFTRWVVNPRSDFGILRTRLFSRLQRNYLQPFTHQLRISALGNFREDALVPMDFTTSVALAVTQRTYPRGGRSVGTAARLARARAHPRRVVVVQRLVRVAELVVGPVLDVLGTLVVIREVHVRRPV